MGSVEDEGERVRIYWLDPVGYRIVLLRIRAVALNAKTEHYTWRSRHSTRQLEWEILDDNIPSLDARGHTLYTPGKISVVSLKSCGAEKVFYGPR